jgi:hypothetical protein
MITLEECKKTLANNETKYSVEERTKILEFLKGFSSIAIEEYYKHHGKGSFLYEGEHR